MELIERVGAFVGLTAFLGLAVLALLYFQQARQVRRLREWAGRAPERAAAAAEQAAAAAERAAERAAEPDESGASAERPPLRERLLDRFPRGLGVRLPEPRYVAVIGAGVVLVAAGVATAVLGIFDDGDEGGGGKGGIPPSAIEVSVLNGTAVAGSPGVPGLAQRVGKDVEDAGYRLGPVSDSEISFAESVVMYEAGHAAEARRVAGDLSRQLGRTPVEEITGDVRSTAGGANVVLIVGQDDSEV